MKYLTKWHQTGKSPAVAGGSNIALLCCALVMRGGGGRELTTPTKKSGWDLMATRNRHPLDGHLQDPSGGIEVANQTWTAANTNTKIARGCPFEGMKTKCFGGSFLRDFHSTRRAAQNFQGHQVRLPGRKEEATNRKSQERGGGASALGRNQTRPSGRLTLPKGHN